MVKVVAKGTHGESSMNTEIIMYTVYCYQRDMCRDVHQFAIGKMNTGPCVMTSGS